MEGLLKDIETMDYYQTSNLLKSMGDMDVIVNRILTNRIKHLTSISSSYEQYANDMNLIKSVAYEKIEEGDYEEALNISQMLFSGQIQNLTLEQVDVAFEGVPTVETEENEMNILDALILVGAAKSKREAREFVNGGSVLINGERIKDLEFTVKKEDAFGQSKTVIRRGKKNYFVLKYNG